MESTMKYKDLDLGTIKATFNLLGGLEGAARLRRGELVLVEAQPKLEPVLDLTVWVDRSVRPTYPDWSKKLMYPELELAGPPEYDLSQVGLWLHDDQKNGVVVGNTIYNRLKKDNAFASCLNLQDGLAIQQKGIAVFRRLFGGKVVFLWGSVVQFCDGDLGVPFLCEDGDEVVVDWIWLDDYWGSSDPALRFSK